MRTSPFDIFHPFVAFCFFAAVIGFTMCAIQPPVILISAIGAVALSLFLRGPYRTFKNLLWQLPIIVIVALVNPLFSASGSTVVMQIGTHPFYLESLICGATFGGLLIAVIVWFSNASCILTSDKVGALFGRKTPTLALMLSMSIGLVPSLVARGKDLHLLQRANTPKQQRSRKQVISGASREISVLMAWSMEDSLEAADTMRARGWGSTDRRTTYRPYRLSTRDAAIIGSVIALLVTSIFSILLVPRGFHFYPTCGSFASIWSYIPFALLVLSPLALEALEVYRWRH